MIKRFCCVLCISFIPLSGCQSPQPKTSVLIQHKENLKTAPEQALQVDPGSKVVGAANNIKVLSIRTTSRDSRLFVLLEVENQRGRRDVLNYRMQWLNEKGIPVAQYDPWETASLEGQEKSVISMAAPTPAATDFRFEMKPFY